MMATRLACLLGAAGALCTPIVFHAQAGPPAQAFDTGTLPPTIPIFPLQDVMLFPQLTRPLHIFEPRYRDMVADALEGDRLIGMVLLEPGHEAEYEGRPPVYPVGSAGIITTVEELPDGGYNILLRGLTKFRITGEDQSRSYRLAHVEAIPEKLSDAETGDVGRPAGRALGAAPIRDTRAGGSRRCAGRRSRQRHRPDHTDRSTRPTGTTRATWATRASPGTH